jgi:L,D-peptidoglycan transpeptidase YkuD (ErfK/YbiS/YcfS/YnhG family)/DNA-binding Lrp family transcriptional regulator
LTRERLSDEARRDLHETLLDAYAALGDYRAAIREALDALTLVTADDDRSRGRVLAALGNAQNRLGAGAEARTTLEAALAALDTHDAKREGDGATPAGRFALRGGFYRADRLALPEKLRDWFRPIEADMAWEDDSASAHYNRMIRTARGDHPERLARADGVYDIVVPLGYNDAPPVAGLGSAIFLHVARADYAPTAGCVALARDDLLAVLRQADEGAVLEIRRSNGDILYQRDEQERIPPRRVFPEEKVAELNTMLSAVVKSGTGRRADLGFAPQGGKTGTNQGYRDAWYIGYTGHYVTGVWYGNDDFTPMKEVTGGLIPAPTWKRIMAEAERGLQPIGLAGIPYDETYAAAAAELPAVQGPLASDERDQAAGAAIAAAAPEEDVNSVLTGMFDLFEAAPSAAAIAAAKASASKTASQEALVLPKANVDQPENPRRRNRILEQIFGSDANIEDLVICPVLEYFAPESAHSTDAEHASGDAQLHRRGAPIDDVDRSLLRTLQVNGRASFAELAEASGISATSAADRFRRLLADGIVKILTLPSPARIGNLVRVTACIRVKGPFRRVLEQAATMPGTLWACATAGPFGVVMDFACRDEQAMNDMRARIMSIPGVSGVSLSLHRKLLRDDLAWGLDDASKPASGG